MDQGTLEACRDAVSRWPDSADAYYNLGLVLKQCGQFNDAAASYREALRLRPSFPEAWNNLGTTLAAGKNIEEARTCFQKAVELDPTYPTPHNNLGKICQELGQLAEAEACFRHALTLRPEYAEAHYNLGVVLGEQRRREEAAACFEAALRVKPGFVEALNNLGNAYLELGRGAAARAALEEALRLRPDFAEARANLGTLCKSQGRLAEAEAHLQASIGIRPNPRLSLEAATLLPAISESTEEMAQARARLVAGLQRLHDEGVRLDLTTATVPTLFFLAYHGCDDRAVQEAWARLCVPPPDPELTRRCADDKIRVGFLSSHFRDHTIGRLLEGTIARIERNEFTVVVLALGHCTDETALRFRGHADTFVELPAILSVARQLIVGQQLDVLVYADVGMDPVTTTLAFSRLAPVQCTFWGHPVTTGIATIDYFLSSEVLEIPEADGHYSEQLIRLGALPVCCERARVSQSPRSRSAFGLPGTGTLYACPQSPFKLHPAFDEVIGEILRRDRTATLALLKGQEPVWEQALRRRFARTLPDVLPRVRFLPTFTRADFLGLNAVIDVLLDPIHFGGGNTSYEGLALGVPIVTLPSSFLRGRITRALYEQMGVLDGIVNSPAEYVEQAVRLGTDREFRAELSARIVAANDILFDNVVGIRALEDFLKQVAGTR